MEDYNTGRLQGATLAGCNVWKTTTLAGCNVQHWQAALLQQEGKCTEARGCVEHAIKVQEPHRGGTRVPEPDLGPLWRHKGS